MILRRLFSPYFCSFLFLFIGLSACIRNTPQPTLPALFATSSPSRFVTPSPLHPNLTPTAPNPTRQIPSPQPTQFILLPYLHQPNVAYPPPLPTNPILKSQSITPNHLPPTPSPLPPTFIAQPPTVTPQPIVPTEIPNPTSETPPTPSSTMVDFAAVRAQLAEEGRWMVLNKIGFHAGIGGNSVGLGEWMSQLDGAGVPFFIKERRLSQRII